MSWQRLIEQREALSERKQSVLFKRFSRLQGALYALLLDRIVSNLETDEAGAIKFTAANIATIGKTKTLWPAYQKLSRSLADWLVKALLQLFGLNTRYFNEVATVSDSLEERARKLLFRNLGYDLDTREIIKDSWLDNLLAQDTVKQQVVNRLNAALQAKMDAKAFKVQFRDAMLDTKTGLGLVTKNMAFHAQNVFMAFDRSTQAVYREKLKLNFAIYAGTIQRPSKNSNGTRPFCWQRVGNLYDKETIDAWNALNWEGKIPTGDVKVNAGGYQCRHHFSWVSDEMASTMQKKGRKLNRMNPPKPKTGKE